jgi:hypothetical protein
MFHVPELSSLGEMQDAHYRHMVILLFATGWLLALWSLAFALRGSGMTALIACLLGEVASLSCKRRGSRWIQLRLYDTEVPLMALRKNGSQALDFCITGIILDGFCESLHCHYLS